MAPLLRARSKPGDLGARGNRDCITKRIRGFGWALGALLAVFGAELSSRTSLQFSAGVQAVEVYATVTDEKGQPVPGLQAADFLVREDGQPQEISVFAAGEFPLSVAVAVDRSFSMTPEQLALAKLGARNFVTALRQEDQAMIIAVGSRVEVMAPLSTDRAVLFSAVQRLDRWGTTALHDAIVEAVDQVQPAKGRRALVLLSDGTDRYSQLSASETLEHVRRTDVLVYPIALGSERPTLFSELAVLTGGRSFHERDPRRLGDALTGLARELRHQYLLGYSPSRQMNPAQPEWRALSVSVSRPNVHVRARDGYLAK